MEQNKTWDICYTHIRDICYTTPNMFSGSFNSLYLFIIIMLCSFWKKEHFLFGCFEKKWVPVNFYDINKCLLFFGSSSMSATRKIIKIATTTLIYFKNSAKNLLLFWFSLRRQTCLHSCVCLWAICRLRNWVKSLFGYSLWVKLWRWYSKHLTSHIKSW